MSDSKVAEKPKPAVKSTVKTASDKELTTTEEPVNPRVPRGWRRVWLLCVLGFMLSTGLPWSCGASPVVWTVQWFAMPGMGDKLLGIHAVLPLLALVVVASRETVPRVWPRMSVAMMSFASFVSLAIVCFSNALPARPEGAAARMMAMALPRPITKFPGILGYITRAWVTIPLAILVGWVLGSKGSVRAPLGMRLTLGLWTVALTAMWMPLGGQWGHFLALLAAGSVLFLAPFVEDASPVLDAKQQRKLLAVSALWYLPLAVLGLYLRFHR